MEKKIQKSKRKEMIDKVERILSILTSSTDNLPLKPVKIFLTGSIIKGSKNPHDIDLVIFHQPMNDEQLRKYIDYDIDPAAQLRGLIRRSGSEKIDIHCVDMRYPETAPPTDSRPLLLWEAQNPNWRERIKYLRQMPKRNYFKEKRKFPINKFLLEYKFYGKFPLAIAFVDEALTLKLISCEQVPVKKLCDVSGIHYPLRIKTLEAIADKYRRSKGVNSPSDIAITVFRGRVPLDEVFKYLAVDECKEWCALPYWRKTQTPVMFVFKRGQSAKQRRHHGFYYNPVRNSNKHWDIYPPRIKREDQEAFKRMARATQIF